MTLTTLALRGITHYWRIHLATTLGLATAAAVLAGAWAVGDSIRESLRELALARIGRTETALVSNQFFREQLAPEAPIIALEGVVTHDPSGRRASRVAIYGVDQRFFEFHRVSQQAPRAAEVLLSPALSDELDISAGDQLLIRLPRISSIPTESLHGAKDDPGRTLRARITSTVPRSAMGEFSLRATQGDVRAAFLPLSRLQRELDQRGLVNTALLDSPIDLKRAYRLPDVGLHRAGTMLQSNAVVFSDELVSIVGKSDPRAQPVMTYLGNTFRVSGREVPYSLIAAIDRPDLTDENSIILNEWMQEELQARQGDELTVDYHLWDPSGHLETKTATFRVAGFTPVQPEDKDLAPEYPGISGATSMSDWDPPFSMDLKKIRPQDEAYWDKYRATPKAFIRLAAGQKLWRSRYGAVTSIRVSEDFREEKLRTALDPGIAGLMQIPVREQAVAASSGSTDFSEYFLYFSFFLIVSALLLAGLFFRFSLEQRSSEIATLRAVGYSSGVLRRIFLTEGFLLALAGGSLGILGSAIYAGLILTGLRTLWVDAVGTRDLTFHLTPTAMALAFGTSLLVGPIVILASLRVISKRDIRDTAAPRKNRALLYASVFTLAGLALLFSGGPGGFFGAGAALLTAVLLGVFYWLRRTATGVNTVTALGIRYAAHRPGRSILCIALIASSAFLVVSVEAFRRDSHHGLPGWRYYGETALPVYYNPGSAEGREALNLGTAPAAKWLTLRLRPGDDASCLNLYAPANPRVLGVPSALLTFPPTGDDTIPAAVDANTLQYVLHSTQGAVIEVGGAKLRIMRVLTDSIFQSELLISDKDFQVAFREEGGFRAFLVDTPEVNEGALETALADYGLDLTSTAARLASFHRVENTYLSTFQALGALGLILGTIGLGTVLIRNILERQRELALLRAVGFPPSALAQMTLAESLFLMATGLAAGIACALITVIPVVSQRGGSIPVWSILGLIGAVLVTGLISTFFAARVLQRMPLLALLRSD